MSFFTDILNKGKEILWIDKPKEIDIAVNAATKAAVNIATPEATPAIDLALWASSRFQEAPTTTVNVALPESNFGFGGSENVEIPSANITQPAPFVPAPVDFEIGEPIKAIDEVRTEANLKSIAEVEDTQGNGATQFIKEVAAWATVWWATTLNPFWALVWAAAGAVNFWINKLTGYGIDDVINPLNEQIDVLKNYSDKLWQEWQEEENYLKILWWAWIKFVNDFVSAPIDYADKYFDIVNMDENKLIDSRIKLNAVASYDEIKRLEDEGQSERAMAMRQFRVDHETELNTASAIKAITSLVAIPLGRVFGVSGVVWATTAWWMLPTIADLIDIGGVDFAKDLKALSLWGRKTISEAPWETFVDVSPDKIVYGSDEYKTLSVEEKFFVKQGFTNEQKNEWYSSGIFTVNQKDIANVKDKVNKLEAEAVQEFWKFLNNVPNADERLKAKAEIEEYVNAWSDFYADVLWEVYKGKSFEKAVRDLSAKFDIESKETVNVDGEKVPIRAYLNAVAAQWRFDTAGSKWRELNNQLYNAWFDTALESLIKNESKFALNSALSAERNLIDGLWALAAEFWFMKVAWLWLAKIGDATNAVTWGMFKSLMSKVVWGVATKVDDVLGPVVGKVLKRWFEEWVEELATNPYYNMVDASKSDKPLTTFDVLSSMAVDFWLWAGIGWITGLPQARDKNLDLISVSKEDNNLDGTHVDAWYRTIVKNALDVIISKDVIDEAKWLSPTNIISTLGKEYLANGGDINAMTAEHFNEEGVRQRKLELIKTPWVFWPNTIEQQQLIIAEEIKSGDKQRIADAIATAQAPYTFMSQVPWGTKTRWEQLWLNENATIQEVVAQIKEKFPVTPKKVTNFLLADGIEWYKKIVNQTIPSSEIAFKDVKINNELQTLISNVNFTQWARTNAYSPSSWNIEWWKEFHDTLMTKPSTLNVATTQSFANSLARPDGKITTWGKTYFYKMWAPRGSVAWFAKDATTGEAIEWKWKGKNIIDFYLYESISDIKPEYFVQTKDGAFVPNDSKKIFKWKLLESWLFNIIWLSKDTTLTFQDLNDNILFTRDLKNAIEVELPDGPESTFDGIVAFSEKFKEVTWTNDAQLWRIRVAINRVTNNDNWLTNYFILRIAQDIRKWDRGILDMPDNVLIDYMSARLIQDPASTKRFIDILGKDFRIQYNNIRDDWFKTREERFYDPEFYSLLSEVVPNLTRSSLRKAVAKSYDLASKTLVSQTTLDNVYNAKDKNGNALIDSKLPVDEQAKLANIVSWVWEYVKRWNESAYLWTKEDFIKSMEKIYKMDVSSQWDVRQFVVNEKVFINSMADTRYALEKFFDGASTIKAEYAMEVSHITKAMREIENYDAKKFSGVKQVWASSAYLDAPMDLFQSAVQRTIDNGTMTINEWKEEILNTFYNNYKAQDVEFVSNFLDKANYLYSLKQWMPIDKFISFATNLIMNRRLEDVNKIIETKNIIRETIQERQDALSEKLEKLYVYPHVEQFYSLKWINLSGLTLNNKRSLMKKLKDYIANPDLELELTINEEDTIAEKKFKEIMRLWYKEWSTNFKFLSEALWNSAPSNNEMNVISSLLNDVDESIHTKLAYAIYKGEITKANQIMWGNSSKKINEIHAKLQMYRADDYFRYYALGNIELWFGILPNDALIVEGDLWFNTKKNRESAWYEYTIKLPFEVYKPWKAPKWKRPVKISNDSFPKKGIKVAPYWTNFYVENWELYLTSSDPSRLREVLGWMFDAYNVSEDKPEQLLKYLEREDESIREQFSKSIKDWNSLPEFIDMYRDVYIENRWLWQWQHEVVVTDSDLLEETPVIAKNPDSWRKMITYANSVFKVNWQFKPEDYIKMSESWISQAEWISLWSDWYANVSSRLNELSKRVLWKQIVLTTWTDLDWFAQAMIEAWANAKNNGNVLRAITSIMSEKDNYYRLKTLWDDVISEAQEWFADLSWEDTQWLMRLWEAFSRLNNKSKITKWLLTNIDIRNNDEHFKYLASLFNEPTLQEEAAVKNEVDVFADFTAEMLWNNSEVTFKKWTQSSDENDDNDTDNLSFDSEFNKSSRMSWGLSSIRQAVALLSIYDEYIKNQAIVTSFKSWRHLVLSPISNYIKSWNLVAPMPSSALVTTEKYMQENSESNVKDTIDIIESLYDGGYYNEAWTILSRISTIDINLKNIWAGNYKWLLLDYLRKVKANEHFHFWFQNAVKFLNWEAVKTLFNRTMDVKFSLETKDVTVDDKFHKTETWTRKLNNQNIQTFVLEWSVLKAVNKWEYALYFDTNANQDSNTEHTDSKWNKWKKSIGQLLWSNSAYRNADGKSVYQMTPWDEFDLSKHPKLYSVFKKHVTLKKIPERTYETETVSIKLPVFEVTRWWLFEWYVNSLIKEVYDYIQPKSLWKKRILLFDDELSVAEKYFLVPTSNEISDINLEAYQLQLSTIINEADNSYKLNNWLDTKLISYVKEEIEKWKTNQKIVDEILNSWFLSSKYADKDIQRHISYARNYGEWKQILALRNLNAIYRIISERLNQVRDGAMIESVDNKILKQDDVLNEGIIKTRQEEIESFVKARKNIIDELKKPWLDKESRKLLKARLQSANAYAVELWIGLKYNTLWWEEESVQWNVFSKLLETWSTPYLIEWTPSEVIEAIRDYANNVLSKPRRESSWNIRVAWEEWFNADNELSKLDKTLASTLLWLVPWESRVYRSIDWLFESQQELEVFSNDSELINKAQRFVDTLWKQSRKTKSISDARNSKEEIAKVKKSSESKILSEKEADRELLKTNFFSLNGIDKILNDVRNKMNDLDITEC